MFNPYSNTVRILAAFVTVAVLFLAALGYALSGLRNAVDDFRALQQHENARMDALHAMYGSGLLGGFAVRNKIFEPSLSESRPVVVQTGKAFGERLEQVRRLTAADASTARATLDDICWPPVCSDFPRRETSGASLRRMRPLARTLGFGARELLRCYPVQGECHRRRRVGVVFTSMKDADDQQVVFVQDRANGSGVSELA